MATARSLALTALAGVLPLRRLCDWRPAPRHRRGGPRTSSSPGSRAPCGAPPGSSPAGRPTSPSPSVSSSGRLAAGPAGLDQAQTSTRKAVRLSRGCIKQVLIEAQAASGDRQDQGEGHRRRRDPGQHGQVPQGARAKSNEGCPVVKPKDTDGDGLTDDVDRCPKVPGPASNQGCPAAEAPLDTDGDGIPDRPTSAPRRPGRRRTTGAPSSTATATASPTTSTTAPTSPRTRTGSRTRTAARISTTTRTASPTSGTRRRTSRARRRPTAPAQEQQQRRRPRLPGQVPADAGPARSSGCPRKYKLVTSPRRDRDQAAGPIRQWALPDPLGQASSCSTRWARYSRTTPRSTCASRGTPTAAARTAATSACPRSAPARSGATRRQNIEPGRLKAVGSARRVPSPSTPRGRAGRPIAGSSRDHLPVAERPCRASSLHPRRPGNGVRPDLPGRRRQLDAALKTGLEQVGLRATGATPRPSSPPGSTSPIPAPGRSFRIRGSAEGEAAVVPGPRRPRASPADDRGHHRAGAGVPRTAPPVEAPVEPPIPRRRSAPSRPRRRPRLRGRPQAPPPRPPSKRFSRRPTTATPRSAR